MCRLFNKAGGLRGKKIGMISVIFDKKKKRQTFPSFSSSVQGSLSFSCLIVSCIALGFGWAKNTFQHVTLAQEIGDYNGPHDNFIY